MSANTPPVSTTSPNLEEEIEKAFDTAINSVICQSTGRLICYVPVDKKINKIVFSNSNPKDFIGVRLSSVSNKVFETLFNACIRHRESNSTLKALSDDDIKYKIKERFYMHKIHGESSLLDIKEYKNQESAVKTSIDLNRKINQYNKVAESARTANQKLRSIIAGLRLQLELIPDGIAQQQFSNMIVECERELNMHISSLEEIY